MGDFADDALDAVLNGMFGGDAFEENDDGDWAHDVRFRRGPEVNTENQHQLTRLRQQLKARGANHGPLRLRPRLKH